MEIDQELQANFPGLQTLELKIESLVIKKSNPRLDDFRRQLQTRVRESIPSLEAVKDQAIFRAYRDFFWRVGIDPTKTRPAGEALARRILAGKDLPSINTFVDSYNLASAESGVPIAAFDLSRIHENSLRMRWAVEGEKFLGIGMGSPISLSGKEVVIEDETVHRLIAIYPYRDSDESKVTEETKDVLLMMCGVPGVDDSALRTAYALCKDYVGTFCEFSR